MESYQYAPSLQFEQSGDLENSRQERAVKWLDIFIVAALYFGTAKLGQFFAIAPGNVTPVWIPSGIILAATLLKGYRIWPGIFLGAFLGNVSSYSTLPSDIGILNVLFAGIANGIGDSLCALVSAFLIFRCTKGRHPFHRLNHISHFIFSGALIGPLISALFGVTGLALTGLLSWSEYSTVFQTWWTGDGVGVLIITPLILSWIKKLQDSGTGNIFRIEDLFYTLILATLCFFSFGFADDHHYMHMSMFAILSLCMWAIFRLEPHVTHLSGLILASSAIIYTVLDVEWLHGHDFNAALIELQLMVALTSITILVLHSMFCEKEIAEKSLDYLAHHDPLTNLPNRLFFKEKLRRNIKSSKIRQSSFAVVFIDLDHFKAVNDTFGHPIGDELLKSVSIRLKNAIRSDDNIARISGDEFVLLLEDIRNDKDIHIMMEKLLAIFSEPFHLQEHKLYASASIGASIFPQHGTAIAELMKNADIAMYSAKHHGRNTYQIFTEELIAETLHNSKIDHAMRSALHDQEFYLVYQPQFNLDTNKITGVEVLLRWVSADIGFISPGVFIPIAEHNGMIRELGLWTLREACLQGKQWLEDGLEFGRIAVNVSANQIHEEDFADNVIQILNEVGFPSTRLELELTESCVMQVPEVSIGHLSKLRTLGINISIDDFGTGYSSLSYLKRLPIDKLKIDRSFVMDLATDANNMAITAAVISMGHAMGLNIIAEGVETEEQADYLKFKYCDEVQGYFYSKPLEVTNFVEFVANWEQRQSLEKLLPRDENKFL